MKIMTNNIFMDGQLDRNIRKDAGNGSVKSLWRSGGDYL
jgi:hypothetical protein